jgi:hypothetical protein
MRNIPLRYIFEVEQKKIKSIIVAFLIFVAPVSAGWGEPQIWTIPRHVNVVAKEVQSRIPDKAHEGLFEAKRLKNGWLYTCLAGYGKSWTEKIQIQLTYISSQETAIQVDAFRVEKGILFDSKKDAPDLKSKTALGVKEI